MPRRSDLVRKLNNLHGSMRHNLIAAGISEAQVDAFTSSLESHSPEEIEAYIAKLHDFKGGPAYKGFMRYYGLKEHEWWENMAHMGETIARSQLREFKLAREASKPLKQAWRQLHVKPKKAAPKQDQVGGVAEGMPV